MYLNIILVYLEATIELPTSFFVIDKSEKKSWKIEEILMKIEK